MKHYYIAGICILFFSMLLYLPFLHVSFLADDTAWLSAFHSKIHSVSDILSCFLFKKDAVIGTFYRPTALLFLGFIEHITRADVVKMRIFNIFIHAANGFLIYFILMHCFHSERFISLLAALFFCSMPIISQTVIWLCNIHDILGTFFFLTLLAVYYFPGISDKSRCIVSPALLFLSLTCKENFIMSVFFLITADWLVFRKKQYKIWRILGFVSILYLAFRFAGYGSIGGYTASSNAAGPLFYAKLIFSYFFYLCIPVSSAYMKLRIVYGILFLLLLFRKKFAAHVILLGSVCWFIFPLAGMLQRFPEYNPLQFGRHYYIPASLLILALFYKTDKSRFYVKEIFMVLMIGLNLYAINFEYPLYDNASLIHRQIAQTVKKTAKKVFLYNVPAAFIYHNKPCPVFYYPSETAADYGYYRSDAFAATYITVYENNFNELNRYTFDPYNCNLQIHSKNITYRRSFEEMFDYHLIPALLQYDDFELFILRIDKVPFFLKLQQFKR